MIVVALFCLFFRERCHAQTCAGDCDGDDQLAVSELVVAVRIALGSEPAAACTAADVDGSGEVGIADLVLAVSNSLGPCSEPLTASGQCMRPGATGLVACNQGMEVRVFRCNDPARCLTEPDEPGVLTTLAFGNIGAQGSFSLSFSAAEAGSAALVFEAQIDTTTTYRTISFGSIAAGGGSGIEVVLLAPAQEAAVRLLAENGFENFAPDGVLEVIDAVALANADTSFAGSTPEAAALIATNEARDDPGVITAIEQGLRTPTPTATRTPTPPGGDGVQRLGAEFLVNSYTLGSQDDPRLASNGDRFVAVWTMDLPASSISNAIVARVYDAQGSVVAPEFRVDTFTLAQNARPDVGMDGGGNFVVVWQNLLFGAGGSEGIVAQRFDSSGIRRGSEFQVDPGSGYPGGPRIAVEPSGSFVVVWQQYYGLFAQRFESTGDKVGTDFQVNAFTVGFQNDLAVVALEGGEFVVAWTSDPAGYEVQDGDGPGVFAQAFDSGGSRLGVEFQVNAYTLRSQSVPVLIPRAEGGGFVVLWQSYGQDGEDFGIFAQGFTSDQARDGPEVQINNFTVGSQESIAATLTGDSGFVVVWESDDPQGSDVSRDGSEEAVFAQRFDGNGLPDGADFQINAFTIGDQDSPAIASTSDGFVVVWESTAQDGDESGLFGQRFLVNP